MSPRLVVSRVAVHRLHLSVWGQQRGIREADLKPASIQTASRGASVPLVLSGLGPGRRSWKLTWGWLWGLDSGDGADTSSDIKKLSGYSF